LAEISQPRIQVGNGFKVMTWVLSSGLFLIVHSLLMDLENLEHPLIPVHMTLLCMLFAFCFSFLTTGRRSVQILAILGLSLAFTEALHALGTSAILFAGGWVILAAWCGSLVIRGGVR
jgi:hypothetical protein